MELDLDDDPDGQLVYRTAYGLARERIDFLSRDSMTAGSRGQDSEWRTKLLRRVERDRGREARVRAEAIVDEAVADAEAGRRPRW